MTLLFPIGAISSNQGQGGFPCEVRHYCQATFRPCLVNLKLFSHGDAAGDWDLERT